MVTVLFATRNRAAILQRVLTDYLQLTAPDDGWQLIVVDNGSTDATPRVLEDFKARLPLEYVVEPAAGKNTALNTGLQHVRGDLIIFTDDDILPSPDWLQQYRRAAAEYPERAMFGGPVDACWPRTPESWVTVDGSVARACFGLFGLTEAEQKHGPDVFPGGNFALRTAIFRTHGYRYNPNIGPDGTSNFAMGSEAELQHRLLRDGYKRWWLRDARVLHIIREEQLSREYMLGRAGRWGRGTYRQDYLLHGHPARLFGIPRWVIRLLVRHGSRALIAWLAGRPDRAFAERWHFTMYWGQLAEGWRLRTDAGPRRYAGTELENRSA